MPILKIRVTSFDKIKENVFEGFRNNQSRKALKGWIKKPKDDELTSTKGMDPKFLRDQMRERLRKKK